MTRLMVIGAVCVLMALPAAGDLVNGSFETGSAIPTPPGFLGLAPGSNAITDWTLVGSGDRIVDYIGTYWQAADGSRSVDLDGYLSGNGGVEQTIATDPGTKYLVTFDMAANPDGGPALKTMDVSAIGGGTQTQSYNFSTDGHTRTSMGWTPMEFLFTADASTTTLSFKSTTSGNGYGPVLDNVSVSAVPVPAAVLLGLLGLGTAGLKLRKSV